ncbi:MAG: hypothetical protein BWY87_01158 [Deltaproteobacteria bacterium ADurb.Bin510]|nr:MAG: hypothetical protein BWY87_01158 [Deltaproteobacteria bacterium ADurb.Bin510]
MGGSPFATGLLFVGLTVAILGLIAAIRGHVLNCLLISLITLSCMVLIRELATMASLNLWPSAVGFSLMGLGQLILLAGAAALVWRYFAAPRL